ncbi:MAG: hypothetical protein KBT58_11085 [Bizionia sp.]|nr:hypothetical protein [Bizionia sp.]
MKNIKILLLVLTLSALNFSCLVDDEDEGGLQGIENSAYLIGFAKKTENESYFVDEGAIVKNYPVSILGGNAGNPTTSDVAVTFTVDPSSTAVAGNEYNLTTSSFVIPAGANYGTIPVTINTGGLDPDAPTFLKLNLTSSTGSVISDLNDSLTINFVGCQSEVDTFTYAVTTIRISDGGLMNSQLENITMESVNVFRTATVGPYGPGAAGGSIGGTEGFTFNDVCGEITVESQNLVSLYSNQVFGSGSVDPVTGDIEITYTITFGSGDRVFTSTYVKQ